jgi:hypothetical protein
LFCFAAKQSGCVVVKIQEKSKMTCEVPNDDCEEKEESTEENKVENFFKANRHVSVYIPSLLDTQGVIPAVAVLYNEFLHATISPPPDRI